MNPRSLIPACGIIASGLLLGACLSDDPTAPDSSPPAERSQPGPIFAVVGSPPTDLGTLGGSTSEASDINASGQLVGWSETGHFSTHAFSWQAGVMADLGAFQVDFGPADTWANAVSDAGHIVGAYADFGAGHPHALLWQGGQARSLSLGGSEAMDVNASGQIVGYTGGNQDEGDARAVMWANGAVINLGTLGGTSAGANAINNQGQVVGSSSTAGGQSHAFLRASNGTMRDLGALGGGESGALDLNAYAQVVGWSIASTTGPDHAILWEGGRLRDLGTGRALGINDNGQVVGLSGNAAFVWYNGVMNSLASLGGNYTVANAINASGQVVGQSTRADGTRHAVRWTLPPVNFWTSRASLPSARRDAAVVAANGLVYAIGGVNSAGTALRTVSLYNPSTNAWTTGVSLPAARQAGTGAAVIGSLLYVAGGYDAAGALTRTLYAYNLTTKTWSMKAAMPIASGCGGAGVISGKLYVVTGCTRSSTGTTVRVGRLHRYDPATNTWATLKSAPEAHYQPAIAVLSGKLYVAGGINATSTTVSRRLDVYTPSTNSWTTKAAMPTARRGAAGALLGGRLHVCGGLSGSSYLATVEAYDPVTNFWVPRAPLATGRSGLGVGVVNGLGYAVGGRTSTSTLSTNARYTP